MWYAQLHEWTQRGHYCALATVIGSEGTPTRMAICQTGECSGSIEESVEHQCIAAASEVMLSGRPLFLNLCPHREGWSSIPECREAEACGASLSVFIEPVPPSLLLQGPDINGDVAAGPA